MFPSIFLRALYTIQLRCFFETQLSTKNNYKFADDEH